MSAARNRHPHDGFNPRPLLLTGESFVVQLYRVIGALFQSTPVIANGRILAFRAIPACYPTGFNPRPLLLTGESGEPKMFGCATRRFNPRPLLLTGESL